MCGPVTCRSLDAAKLGSASTLSWASTHFQVEKAGGRQGVDGIAVGVGRRRDGCELGRKVRSDGGEGLGDAVSPPHTLPGATWQLAGATMRGSFGLSNVNESATVTSDWMSPLLIGPERVICAPPAVQPMAV